MRVLHIGLSKNPGGIETFVMNYFRKLVQCGIIFDFIDIYGDGLAFQDEIKQLGGHIYTVANYKRHPIKAKKQIMQILHNDCYRCVHINSLSAANLLCIKAALQSGIKPIVHSHNTATEGMLRKFLHSINVKKLRKMNVVRLACGKSAGVWLWGKDDFTIIPNAIDVERFSFNSQYRFQKRSELNIEEDEFLIGFVGRFSSQKNPLYLLDVLLASKKMSDKKVKLLLVGDGELKGEMQKRVKYLDLCDDVIFAGIQNNTSIWYSAMDCFILPSIYEGLPVVAIEAQANGLPCLISDAVSQEVKISHNAEILPLEKDALNWGERICSFQNKRDENASTLLDTEYDIAYSSCRLKNIYLNLESDV